MEPKLGNTDGLSKRLKGSTEKKKRKGGKWSKKIMKRNYLEKETIKNSDINGDETQITVLGIRDR